MDTRAKRIWAMLIVAVLGAEALWGMGVVLRKSAEVSRDSTSTENMGTLANGLIAYSQDHGGRLPPRPTQGDWVAKRWKPGKHWLLTGPITVPTVAEPGPLAPYIPGLAAWCPPDPGPAMEWNTRGGYRWNVSLAGKTLPEVVNKPLLWPYRSWTRRGRWVGTIRLSPGYLGYPAGAAMPGRQWVRDEDFGQVVRTGTLPTYQRRPDE